MATADLTPYSTVAPLFPAGALPSWVPNELDQQRLASYTVYEKIYWLIADTFKFTFRGQEDRPVYLPTPRTIVDTMNRYVGNNPALSVVPRLGSEQTADIVSATQAFSDLFTRERFYAKYASSKRYGLIRGDWVFHIVADAAKPAGSRISIYSVDPAAYFPIYDEDNLDRIIGCHIVEPFKQGNEELIRRQTYRKTESGGISNEEGLFKVDKWGGPEDQPVKVIKPPTDLPPTITALPVYHIKNLEEPQNPFGSSELRGFEMLLSSLNQSITDEDLALALDGLGIYVTNMQRPVDDDGQEMDWVIGPGRVIETEGGSAADSFFNRIQGVGSVQPYGDHLDRITAAIYEGAGIPDIARGNVEVAVAQSGIALSLKLAPILSKAGEKDLEVQSVLDQMYFDIANGFFAAYEGHAFADVIVKPAFGDKVPVNRDTRVNELNNMLLNQVISKAYYRQEMTKLGYTFPADIDTQVQQDAADAAAAADPYAGRLDGELA